MKVSREQAESNRERVVETASRLFRTHGVNGIGIADLMRASGLTHGGFYGQFRSKDALAAEAARRSLGGAAQKWARIVAGAPDNPLSAIVDDYVSDRHRVTPDRGCALASLSADAARKGGAVAEAIETGFLDLVAILEEQATEGDRRKALAMMSQMIGAVIMARAVKDEALAAEILDAARSTLKEKGAPA